MTREQREQLIEILQEKKEKYWNERFDYGGVKVYDMAIAILEQEPKHGKWIVDRYCSECEWDKQEASYTSGWRENYCPNCGARMEE